MKKEMLTLCTLFLALATATFAQEKLPYWQDVQTVGVNKEYPRSAFMTYPNREKALTMRYENQVAVVSCKEVIRYGHGDKKIVLVDCGVKHNILRCFIRRGVELIRVPWDYDFNTLEYDGLFISNGPGNPALCGVTVEHIREAMKKDKPIFGICMGNQLLCVAGGASTYKLKYGHRSHNQPVRMVGTNRCFITSQNHGFAVDNATLGNDWEPLFINMNDGTNEGIRHKTRPFFSAQFHPEATSGPTDTEFLFDEFISKL